MRMMWVYVVLWGALCLGIVLLLLPLRGQPTDAASLIFVRLDDSTERNDQLWRMWRDGSRQTQLTDLDGRIMQPEASPNGQSVFFVSNHTANQLDQLYRMDLPQSTLTQLTNAAELSGYPAVSPNEEWVLFSRYVYDTAQLFLVRPDGTEEHQITSDRYNNFQPAWSPDGKQIAFAGVADGNSDIFIMNLENGTRRRITQTPIFELFPHWSPDGEWITFISDFQLHKVRASTTQPWQGNDTQESRTRLTPPQSSIDVHDPRWSPDGEWIAFWGEQTLQRNVYLIRPDGSEMHAVTQDGASVAPRWIRIRSLPWAWHWVLGLGIGCMLLGTRLVPLGRET